MTRKRYVVGNWKMNKCADSIRTFFGGIGLPSSTDVSFGIAPQTIHIGLCVHHADGRNLMVGAQNASSFHSGAYTGENSAECLADAGCEFVILGHSERRALFKESHETLNEKVKTALKTNMKIIFCVGETLEQRENERTMPVLEEQLVKGLADFPVAENDRLIIAYEPVWAIGTGKTATPLEAKDAHIHIRKVINHRLGLSTDTSILYGGSVKVNNFEELLATGEIDGGLVGGASLEAEDFTNLCRIANKK